MKRKYTLKITFLPKISKQVLIPGHNIWEEEDGRRVLSGK